MDTKKYIDIIGFWDKNINFNNFQFPCIKSHIFHDYEQVNDTKTPDIVIYGCFTKADEDDKYINNKDITKILYISEPIYTSSYIYVYEKIKSNYFEYVFGSIENNINLNYFKIPYYYVSFHNISDTFFNELNNKISNINNEDILNKKFCSLINSHDNWGTRTKIFNEINKIKKIECPGKLFNNVSNELLNSVGKNIYLNNFIFNICSENSVSKEFQGYITEKLADACLSGAIPIYCGYFDDIDSEIFNKNRIIFYDYTSQESINNAIQKIKFLLNNNNELCKFYKQKPFFKNTGSKLNSLLYSFKSKF